MKQCFLLLPLAALPLTACSGPECDRNFDCGAYSVCSDGLCVAGDRPDVAFGGVAPGGVDGDFGGDATDWIPEGIEAGDAWFKGTIGNAVIDGPMLLSINQFDRAAVLQLTTPESPTTFVFLTLDDITPLSTPGTFTLSRDVGGAGVLLGQSQACDDTVGHYDEVLPAPVVTVPDEADDEAAEDVPVIGVEFGVDDDGGTVLGDTAGHTAGVASFRFRVVAPD